jgi:hypothetical protein
VEAAAVSSPVLIGELEHLGRGTEAV